MSKRILSVSYDASLLATRQMMLELRGYTVISALGFTEALEKCKASDYDLFILGHSILKRDKQELIRAFRESCSAPILALERVGRGTGGMRLPRDSRRSGRALETGWNNSHIPRLTAGRAIDKFHGSSRIQVIQPGFIPSILEQIPLISDGAGHRPQGPRA